MGGDNEEKRPSLPELLHSWINEVRTAQEEGKALSAVQTQIAKLPSKGRHFRTVLITDVYDGNIDGLLLPPERIIEQADSLLYGFFSHRQNCTAKHK